MLASHGAPPSNAPEAIMRERKSRRFCIIILSPRYSNSSTTTDFDGSVALKPSGVVLKAVNSAGFTASGFSNVLCAFISGAVKMRPESFCAFAPARVQATSAGWLGFKLQRVT